MFHNIPKFVQNSIRAFYTANNGRYFQAIDLKIEQKILAFYYLI